MSEEPTVMRLDMLPSPGVAEEKPALPSEGKPAVIPRIETEVERKIVLDALAVSPRVRAKAFRLFLSGNSPQAIVDAVHLPGVNLETLAVWAREGAWAEAYSKHNDAIDKVTRESLRSLRLRHAHQEAESAILLGKRIRDRAMEILDSRDPTPQELKFIADAAKASGDISAHGMGTAAGEHPEAGVGAGAGGKQPLVIVFPNGGLPPMRPEYEPKVVEVKDDGNR